MTLLVTLMLIAASPLGQPPQSSANPTIGSVRGMMAVVKGFISKAAAQVPEEHYSFKPAPTVRSMGEVFAHVADANYLICGMASGQKPPSALGELEKTKKTKADISTALAESFKFCESAFDGLTDASANETVKFFVPGTHTRLGILAFNVAHGYEHYGNIVTYMRIKGMVPPSSGGM